jgi:hypothetical protein
MAFDIALSQPLLPAHARLPSQAPLGPAAPRSGNDRGAYLVELGLVWSPPSLEIVPALEVDLVNYRSVDDAGLQAGYEIRHREIVPLHPALRLDQANCGNRWDLPS